MCWLQYHFESKACIFIGRALKPSDLSSMGQQISLFKINKKARKETLHADGIHINIACL